jgi:error-prone DNA polymerase
VVTPDPAIPLWDEGDLLALLQAEADSIARAGVIHLLDDYRPMLEEIGVLRSAELAGLRENTEVLVAGRRTSTERDRNKAVVVSLEDGTGLSAAAFASESQSRAGSVLFGTELLLIAGTTTRGDSLRATNAWDLRKLLRDWEAQIGPVADFG